MLHSDRGGEFVNEDITRLAEYLDVKLTNTAAHSPTAVMKETMQLLTE